MSFETIIVRRYFKPVGSAVVSVTPRAEPGPLFQEGAELKGSEVVPQIGGDIRLSSNV